MKLKRDYGLEELEVKKILKEAYKAKKELENKKKQDLLEDLNIIPKKPYIVEYKGNEYKARIYLPELSYQDKIADIRVRFLQPYPPETKYGLKWVYIEDVVIIREATLSKVKITKLQIIEAKKQTLSKLNKQINKIQMEIEQIK